MSPQSENPFSFTLELLKLLAQKPQTREELCTSLTAYLSSKNCTSGDISQKVARTVRRLRDAGFEIESAPHRPYRLQTSNFPVILTPAQQEALAMAIAILADMGFSAEAGHLSQIVAAEDEPSQTLLKTDFSPPVDYSRDRTQKIVEQLRSRLETQHRFVIRYRSSSGKENNYDLDRSELRLHNGVLYLFSFVPAWNSWRSSKSMLDRNRLFRVDRILSMTRPSDVPWCYTIFPTETFRYRMSGPLANYRPRRHQERVIDEGNGFVEIETREDCEFWFRQRILQYGSNVRVLSPEWFARDIEKEWRKAFTVSSQRL
ncbi:WYL domain-containing protein [Baaleninema simplex]|uniref:WYL domain-containing protein n=1 Tax=Baaleninema simplex TaxID=2862350 RepID=UPI00034DE683|nr:WYL domain-containing protein [Baaleninema simplex]